MKKLLSFICIAGLLCALVACTESDTTNPANQNEANITENQQQENTPKEPEKPYYRKDCCTPQYDSGNMVMREVYEVVDTKNLRDEYLEEQINTIEGFLKYHTPDYTNDKVTVFKDGKEVTSGGFEVGMVVRLYHGDEFCGDYTIKKVMRYPPEIPFTEEDIPEGGFEPAKFVFDKKVETFLADIATAKTANGDKYGYRTVVMQNGKEVTSGTIEQDMSYLLYQGDELYEEYPFIEVFPELFIDTTNQQQENTPKEPEKPYYRKDCCTPQYDSGNMVMREVYEVVDTKNLRDDYFEEQINTIEGFLKYHTPDYTNDKVTVFKDGKEMTSGGFEVGMVVRLYHGDEFCGDYTIKKVMRYPPEIPFTEEDIPEGGFEAPRFTFEHTVEAFLENCFLSVKYGYRVVVMQNGKEVTSGPVEQDMSYLLYQGDDLYEEYPFIETSPHIFIDTTGIEFPEPIF